MLPLYLLEAGIKLKLESMLCILLEVIMKKEKWILTDEKKLCIYKR